MFNKIFQLPGWVLFTVSLLFLFIAGIYSVWQEQRESLQNTIFFENAAQHQGETVCISHVNVYRKTSRGVLAVSSRRGKKYQLIINPALIKLNQHYSFAGVLNPDGKITVRNFQHHPHRKLKYIFSLLSLPVVLFLLLKYIRWDRAGGGFTVKSNPN